VATALAAAVTRTASPGQGRTGLREPDPRDRRKNAVTVTPAGTRTLERCARLADRANAELPTPLRATERHQLMELLKRVHEA
jgi:DNA-binding MarR family transcriptional regulator